MEPPVQEIAARLRKERGLSWPEDLVKTAGIVVQLAAAAVAAAAAAAAVVKSVTVAVAVAAAYLSWKCHILVSGSGLLPTGKCRYRFAQSIRRFVCIIRHIF